MQDDPYDFDKSNEAAMIYHSGSGTALRRFDFSTCREPIVRKPRSEEKPKSEPESPDLLDKDRDESESHEDFIEKVKVGDRSND